MRRDTEAGFSLIELMVAMVITLIIVGSMVGLLTSGQSAFSTQPERTDRQQNMRVAMDIIMRDVAGAGVGMPGFMQVFKRGEDGTGPNRPDGTPTDKLVVATNNSGFDSELVCGTGTNANGPTTFTLEREGSALEAGMPVIVIFGNGTWTTRTVAAVGPVNTAAVGDCAAGNHQTITLDSDPNTGGPFGNAGAAIAPPTIGGTQVCLPDLECPCKTAVTCQRVQALSPGSVVTYEVRLDPLENNFPSLYRTENSGTSQLVARGIEDLQVQYVQSDAAWPATTGTVANEPPLVNLAPAALFGTLTTEVRVTLSARTTKQRIQGASQPGASNTLALRGSLIGQGSPRQALWMLTQEPTPAPVLRWN